MTKWASISAPHFNLRLTLESGQVFHWLPEEGGAYRGLIGHLPVRVKQEADKLWVTPGAEAAAARYFALDHDLPAICASFPTDAAMTEAAAFCGGLRLIRQPLWECLATFLTSSMKQVAHIRQMSLALRQRFGRPVSGWHPLAVYPQPERLAQATEEELRACGLGFRARHLLGTARHVAEGVVDLEAIRTMDDAAVLAELCRLPGVGPKIANCVLLFAYERLRAFPIDVWIERVLRKSYFTQKRKVTAKQLREFAAGSFGPYGGYAQQYLFHHARSQSRLRS
ncbi:MAG: DNA glycosylase [Verrucomicrobiota bacterium]